MLLQPWTKEAVIWCVLCDGDHQQHHLSQATCSAVQAGWWSSGRLLPASLALLADFGRLQAVRLTAGPSPARCDDAVVDPSGILVQMDRLRALSRQLGGRGERIAGAGGRLGTGAGPWGAAAEWRRPKAPAAEQAPETEASEDRAGSRQRLGQPSQCPASIASRASAYGPGISLSSSAAAWSFAAHAVVAWTDSQAHVCGGE